MFQKKYRNLIPSESDSQKSKDKSTYCESWDIGDWKGNVKLMISSIHSDKTNYDVQGTFLYQLTNASHFQVDAELDFKNSSHIRIQEKNSIDPKRTLYQTHIEPFDDNCNNRESKNKEDEKGICKVQYHRGYILNVHLKFALTFPSLEKQRTFLVADHNSIKEYLSEWKKYKPSHIEYLWFMNKPPKEKKGVTWKDERGYNKKNEIYNVSMFYKKIFSAIYSKELNEILNSKGANDSDTRSINIKARANPTTEQGKKTIPSISFVDESFPPFSVDFITIDFSKGNSLSNPIFLKTEAANKNQKSIAFHYRPIESIFPGCTQIIDVTSISPFEIQFGWIKNDNIISVFAHWASNPKYWAKWFPEIYHSDIGIYKVNLFINNSWKEVYVDKYIACFPLNYPIYTYATDTYWPSILEKAIAKVFGGYDNLRFLTFMDLYTILTGLPVWSYRTVGERFCENSNYLTQATKMVSDRVWIDYMRENYKIPNKYLIACYASNERLESLNYPEAKAVLENRIFPIKDVQDSNVEFNTIYFFELEKWKEFKNNEESEKDKYPLETLFKFFDNFIIVKCDNYKELHFRNGFIRCQDTDFPDYDRILAHSYYEVKIKSKDLYTDVTIVLRIAQEPLLEDCFWLREIDWKIGIIPWEEKPDKMNDNLGNKESDLFNGKTPIYFETPDFIIGYSLVLDIKLHTGTYIIFPMTMGYTSQKNKKIKFTEYSLKDKKSNALPIEKTVIPYFLEDLFYINDPFCKNYLDYKVVKHLVSNIIDNKGRKSHPLDEEEFNSYFWVKGNHYSNLLNRGSNYNNIYNSNYNEDRETHVNFSQNQMMKFANITNRYFSDNQNKGQKALSKTEANKGATFLWFKEIIYDHMNLLHEEYKKQCMHNLGYDYNMFPFIGRLIGISFYFENKPYIEVAITPRNNLIDRNMDSILNIKILEKQLRDFGTMDANKALRISSRKDNGWYTIEGVFMKKDTTKGKATNQDKLYEFPEENDPNVFYSTNKSDITTWIYPGRMKFVMYVVDNVWESSDEIGEGKSGNEKDLDNKEWDNKEEEDGGDYI